MEELIKKILKSRISKVTEERFKNILNFQEYVNNLPGDIIECGVWKGGMSIFLAETFPDKKLWIADSFSGFQNLKNAKYYYKNDRHQKGRMAVSRKEVESNFEKFNIDINKVEVLEGYVNDTLPECSIKDIALLRIDVDAYSATLEVLENLYDKVVEGGLIVLDDTCLPETHRAVKTFLTKKEIEIQLKTPLDKDISIDERNLPCGCYFIKNSL